MADDGHKFTINGTLAAAGTSFKVPVQTDVARFLKPGVNTLRVEVENGSPSPAGLLARLSIKLKDGRVIERVTDASWKTIGDPGANWHNREIDVAPLPAAEVVANYGDGPWGKLKITGLALPKPSYLRTTFDVAKPVRPCHGLHHGLGDSRRPPQRRPGQRRLLQPRLDRLHPTRLLPDLRRHRP